MRTMKNNRKTLLHFGRKLGYDIITDEYFCGGQVRENIPQAEIKLTACPGNFLQDTEKTNGKGGREP